MKKITINTDKAPAAIGPYAQGMQYGNTIYTSGQLPINMQTGELESEIKQATKASLDNVSAVLACGGASMSDVLKVTIFLKDLADFVAMNEVYTTYFPSNPPARSCVQVAKLPKDAVIEIEAIAIVG